ncbi:MAG: hypothetical protein N3A38_12950, partial [Planctomycetota bacterium]|nr:hypothetical protein [Planctomycetota bacterium]
MGTADDGWMAPETLAMPRHRIGRALPDQAIRIRNGRGGVSVRDRTVTGFKTLIFPPVMSDSVSGQAETVGYRAGLAFREEGSGALIQDVQDEVADPLYFNYRDLKPFDRLGAVMERDRSTLVMLTQDAVWRPDFYERTGTFHRYVGGRLVSFGIRGRL